MSEAVMEKVALADETSRRKWFENHARGLYAYDSTLSPYTNIFLDEGAKLIMTGISEAVLNGAGWGEDDPPNGRGRGLPWDHTHSLLNTFQVWHSQRERDIVYYLTRDDRYDFAFQRYVLRRHLDTKEAVTKWSHNRYHESATAWYPYPGINWEITKKFMMPYDYTKNMELPEEERMGYVFSHNGGLLHDDKGWRTCT